MNLDSNVNLDFQINLCSKHYQKWKDLALTAVSIEDCRKCLEKAFFWLELQTAFITLWAVENMAGSNPIANEKIILAKANLSKKLADYAKQILDEIKI